MIWACVMIDYSHVVCFVGATLDSVGVGAQAVEKTALIVRSVLVDMTYTRAFFERGEVPQQAEVAELSGSGKNGNINM